MTIREIALVAARHSTRVAYAMRAALMALGVRVSPLDAKAARHRG